MGCVAPEIEEHLDFMNMTICHLATLDPLHVYVKHDAELMAEIWIMGCSGRPRFALRHIRAH
jgi:hypothetical protein